MAIKTVIEGTDSVKASQLKEFFRQVDEKIITGTILQKVLENKNPFQDEMFRFGKYELRSLVELIAGGENKKIPIDKIGKWKMLLMYAIRNIRENYERLGKNDDLYNYYLPCWVKFDNAKNEKDFCDAIDFLIDSITYQ